MEFYIKPVRKAYKVGALTMTEKNVVKTWSVGVGRMKKLGLLAVVVLLAVLVTAAPYAAAVGMVKVNGKLVNYSKVMIASDAAWENRTNDYGNITFNAEGLEWILVPYNRKNENEPIFSVGLKTPLDSEEENAAAAGVQGSKSDVDTKSIIDTRTDEEKFAGDEYKNALPVPRPPGFESAESSEEAGKGSGLAATQGAQWGGKAADSAQPSGQAKAPQSGTESVGSGPNAAKAASSEAASSPTASSAKEPGEAKKDKSGEKKESFFAKVLKWLFGK